MKFRKIINGKQIEVTFLYEESCSHVYKTFKVFVNGSKSNVKGLLKYLENTELPEILTKNTFYWSPASKAACRRKNEKRENGEVYDFFIKNGFQQI